MTVEFEKVKDLIKKYYQLFEYSSSITSQSVRGGIETRLEEFSLNGREIIELFSDLKILAKREQEEETRKQVGMAIEIYNNKRKYK